MLSVKDVAVVYETLLSSPGMHDAVKISMNIPRKQVLLLAKVIDLGLAVNAENGQAGLLSIAEPVTIEELRGIAEDILEKAGLTAMHDKLNALQSK